MINSLAFFWVANLLVSFRVSQTKALLSRWFSSSPGGIYDFPTGSQSFHPGKPLEKSKSPCNTTLKRQKSSILPWRVVEKNIYPLPNPPRPFYNYKNSHLWILIAIPEEGNQCLSGYQLDVVISDTPRKINILHIMEVCFRSCSFMGDGCRFQPFIFQGSPCHLRRQRSKAFDPYGSSPAGWMGSFPDFPQKTSSF